MELPHLQLISYGKQNYSTAAVSLIDMQYMYEAIIMMCVAFGEFCQLTKPSYTWPETVLSLTKGSLYLTCPGPILAIDKNPLMLGPKQFCH